MKRCSRIIVKGKVQGVLFRDYIKEHAQELEIEGTVQNSHDGSVVINACGSCEHLDDFIDVLYQGPPESEVDEVIEEPLSYGRDFRGVFRKIGSG